jgi:translation elongation factor EF-Ts
MNPVRVGDMSSVSSPGSEPREQHQPDPEAKPSLSEAEEDEDMLPLPVKKNDSEDLVLQDFLLDQDVTVGQALQTTGIDVKDFVRFELGQQTEETS